MSRRVALLGMMVMMGCNPDRDALDESLEHSLDLILAEREELESNRAARQLEHDELRKVLDSFTEVTTPELLALAGEGAAVDREVTESFYRVVTIQRGGPWREGVAFLRAALAKSKSVNVTFFAYRTDSWTASVAVANQKWARRPVGGAVAPSSDKTWCYAGCRDRRQRIADKNARLAMLDASLGSLIELRRDRKSADDLLLLDSKFAGDGVIPVLERLISAEWMMEKGTLAFSAKELQISGSPELAPACAAMFAACVYDASHRELIIGL